MSEDIRLVNFDKMIGKSIENNIIEGLASKSFFDYLDKHGYNRKTLNLFFGNKEYSPEEFIRFNSTLKQVKEDLSLHFYEIILYLEDVHIKYKKIVHFLDDEIKFSIKQELGSKYGYMDKELSLDEFWERI